MGKPVKPRDALTPDKRYRIIKIAHKTTQYAHFALCDDTRSADQIVLGADLTVSPTWSGWRLRGGAEGAMVTELEEVDDDCIACVEESPRAECPKSKRECGHHCNHSWTHDKCCWCGAEFGEETT